MVDKEQIEELLNKFGTDNESNLIKIRQVFESVFYKDEENQTLLHILCDDKYDKYKCFNVIKCLLEAGLSPNEESDFGYNFIQTALYTGYDEDFVLKIIKESFPYGLNTNHIDYDGETMVHTAIYSDKYKGKVDRIYQTLVEYGLDSNIKDKKGNNILEAIKSEKKFTESEIVKVEKLFEYNIKELEEAKKKYKEFQRKEESLKKRQMIESKLEDYGQVLTTKSYKKSPTIGREQELKNLIVTLAQDKKNPIIVGESGVGKTVLVEELAYRIQIGEVPNFLKNKMIVEINPNELVAGCEYVGQFEKKMKELMSLCDNENIILFIDEIHTMYGVGTTKNNDNDMASMLRHYADRLNFKIIGTTTKEEYNKYFSTSSFKRRFERIEVKEPDNVLLYQIIDKIIEDNCNNKNLKFENSSIKNQIINIIIEVTSKGGRVYDDPLCNPDLAISIVDKAFAFALVYDSEFITKEHFIESFKCNDRIYKSRCEHAIERLKKIIEIKETNKSKILSIDFRGRK